MDPLIINVALTGCLFSKDDNEYLPVTVDEIVKDASMCYDAGASIFHIHAREKRHHAPTWKPEVYAELIGRLRNRLPRAAIICVSCSGRHWEEFDKRAAVLDLEGIDMASLTLGTVHFPTGDSITTERTMLSLLYKMQGKGIMPEAEIFDRDMIYTHHELVGTQQISRRARYVNLFFGVHDSMKVDPYIFTKAVNAVYGATWAATGLGKHQFEVNCWAVAMGGHVRVGLEDSLWMDKGVKATNLAQVMRIAAMGRSMGREPATAKQAREMIWQQ